MRTNDLDKVKIKLSMHLNMPSNVMESSSNENLNITSKLELLDNIASQFIDFQIVELSLKEVIEHISKGMPYCPAIYKPVSDGKCYREPELWSEQSIFVVDLNPDANMDNFKMLCNKSRTYPFFIYRVLDSLNEDIRYRALFLANHPVTDKRERFLISYILNNIFNPNAEIKPLDSDNIYCDNLIEGIDYDFSNFIDTVQLIENYTTLIRIDDNGGNYTRDFKHFAMECSLNMVNNTPNVYSLDKSYFEVESELRQVPVSALVYSPIYVDERTVSIVNFNKSSADFYPLIEKARKRGFRINADSEIQNVKTKFKYIEKFKLDRIADTCILAKQFEDGCISLDYDSLKLLASNYMQISGGKTRFIDVLEKYPSLYDNETKLSIQHFTKFALDNKYAPASCSINCPIFKDCNNLCKSIIDRAYVPKGGIRLMRPPTIKSEKTSVKELEELLISFLTNGTNYDKLIAKFDTGVGKSTILQKLLKILNLRFVYATPLHNLNQQVARELGSLGLSTAIIPPLPVLKDTEFNTFIQTMYKTGNYSDLYKKIKQKKEELKVTSPEDFDLLEQYTNAIENAEKSDRVIMTQDKLLFTKDKSKFLKDKDVLVIDEDILKNLMKINYLDLKDFDAIYNFACESSLKYPDAKRVLNQYKDMIQKLDNNRGNVIKRNDEIISRSNEKFVQFLSEAIKQLHRGNSNSNIDSNIVDFFLAHSYTKVKKNNSEVIAYVNKKELPDNIKIVILSATANEMVYKKLYNDIQFVDGGYVEKLGKIVQYSKKTYSRQNIEKRLEEDFDGFINDIKSKIDDNTKIACTHKFLKKEFEERNVSFLRCEYTFGQEIGFNNFTGQNIAIIGTPNVPEEVYILFASALGIKVDLYDNTDTSYVPIERNGIAFWFNTYSESPELQELQFYIVESQLYQAIGRARLIRNDCTVYVFSNMPVVGAIYMD